MGRSTRLAWGPRLRRAITPLLPLLAACALAPPAQAGVRSQAASQRAIASALAQSTGLAPSQVTSQDVCGTARPGFATCAVEALVLRSDHARVRPNVHGGPSFTQVFPAGGRGIPTVRPAVAGGSQPEPGTPAWLQQAYDLTYLSQTRGAGDTVAIVDAGDDPSAESDLAVFRSAYGLPACTTANGCFEKVNQSGQSSPLPTPNPVWEPEESLDVDAVSALCPNCKILLVEASDASDTNLDRAVVEAANLHANQISNSWSDQEPTPIFGTYSFANAAVIAATGDTGYVGGGYDAYPAAFPSVTAAGGTSLAPVSGGQSARGFGESAWSVDDWGSAASSGCDVSQPKPAYQHDTGCTGRAYSDLSADADPETGLMVYGSAIGGWWQYGGTSLATPLIAAYEAITGVNGTTPQWAYTDSALLNDPVTGSSGDCPPDILYICQGGAGYDGPTGVGSISGAVVAGAPGIGGPSFGSGTNNTYTEDVGATTATLSAGVYPNGLDTSYYWQYGTTTSYGSQSQSVDLGAGQAPGFATAALNGLAPATTYHYRLVAQNTDGTTYGYDSMLTTESPPVLTAYPSIAGDARLGQMLSANPGGWALAGGPYSYEWQRSPNGWSWTSIAGATGSSYTVGEADAGDYLRVAVTATNAYGGSTATSPSLGPVPAAFKSTTAGRSGPRWTSRPRVSADPGRVGDTLTITPARWAAARLRGKVTRVMRCTNTCVSVGSPNVTSYTITPADVGSVLWVRSSASIANGTAVVWSSRAVGPVASPSSAAVVLSGGRTALRNSRGATLAFATISSISPSGDAVPARAGSRKLALRRALGVSGRVTAWVCQAARPTAGAPPRCTQRVSLRSRMTVPLPGWMGGAVRVVVVRQSR